MSKSSSPFRRSSFRVLLVLLGSLIFSTLILADGDSREATKAEKEAYRLAINTFAKAVPSGPAGWDTIDRKKIEELKYIGYGEGVALPGLPENPLQVEYYIAWRDTARKEAAKEKIEEALYAQQSGAQNSSNDDLWQRYEGLAEEFGDMTMRLTQHRLAGYHRHKRRAAG